MRDEKTVVRTFARRIARRVRRRGAAGRAGGSKPTPDGRARLRRGIDYRQPSAAPRFHHAAGGADLVACGAGSLAASARRPEGTRGVLTRACLYAFPVSGPE